MNNILAINGGPKTWNKKLPVWPQFNPDVDDIILKILHSGKVNYWTGNYGTLFEEKWSEWLGCKYSISVSSGTSALHTALLSLDIGSGDEVICTPYSFIASSYCVLQCGALPVFCDVGTDHLIDPQKIEENINERTKAILVVHLYGMVVDMDPILEIAKKYNLYVVEDCAQCFGGLYKGKKVGTIGTIGCFSFCQEKHFTTGGEGGMVCCNNEDLAWKIKSIRDHGYDVKERLRLFQAENRYFYIHSRIGYNFRMTEIQSAIGIYELKRLDDWNLKNRKIFSDILINGIGNNEIIKYKPIDTEDRRSSFWLVPFVIDLKKIKCNIKQFNRAIQMEGIKIFGVQWPEMYKNEVYQKKIGFGKNNYPFSDPLNRNINYSDVKCPVAHSMLNSTISFWVHPVYNVEYMNCCVEAFNKVTDFYKI